MKILLTGISARSLAESAVRSGYPVLALDAFGDLDLKHCCESYALARDFNIQFSPAGLYQASRRLQFDSVAYTSNLENYPEVVRKLARRRQLLGNSAASLRGVRDWPRLYGALDRAGFRTPETIFHTNGRVAHAGRTWICKPVHSGGGHGVAFVEPGQPARPGYIVQEYIPGVPCSASFVSNGEQAVVIGLSEQLIGRPEFGMGGFAYCGNLVPLAAPGDQELSRSVMDQAQQIASLLTQAFGLVGVNGFDFILSDGQITLTEVNPRYSASMELIEKAYALPVFDLHVRAVTLGELPDFHLHTSEKAGRKSFFGKAILFADRDVQARDTQRWLRRQIRDIPHPGEFIRSGNPVCTLLAEGSTRETCLARLVASAQEIKGEMYA